MRVVETDIEGSKENTAKQRVNSSRAKTPAIRVKDGKVQPMAEYEDMIQASINTHKRANSTKYTIAHEK